MLLFLCLMLGVSVFSFAYDNIALGKPAYQQYPYFVLSKNKTDANNAVDGLKSELSWYGEQCVISENNRRTATWWVNLTTIVRIHHITIYYMRGRVPWGRRNGFTKRFLGFSLYVSNTTNRSDGTLCYKDTSFTIDTIPAIFNTTCLAYGQYVIYYNERISGDAYPDGYSLYAWNEICELEVFGCLQPDYWGVTCSTPCSEHCLLPCHIETGTCQGCKTGYQGDRCELGKRRGSLFHDDENVHEEGMEGSCNLPLKFQYPASNP